MDVTPENQGLLRRLREGDGAALRAIYEQYKDHLLTAATCLLLDRAAAEDALHDAFVAFAGQARRLRIDGSLKAYLTACVVNRTRDQLRRSARGPGAAEQMDGLASPAPGPFELAANGEEADRLRAALGELAYEQREVIVLHLHAGMSFKEVAREQGASINTAQSRYRYGIDKLRRLLKTGVRT